MSEIESFERTLLELYRLPWYATLFPLVVTLFSFADPITDILTLIEFYRAEHYTWFGVGLAFVILPCLMYPFVHYFSTESATRRDLNNVMNSGFKLEANNFLFGFHPFSPAFANLQAFYYCLKNIKDLWNKKYSKSEPPPRPAWADVKTDALFLHKKLSSLIEALLESAPQIIIQLYAIGVQEESVKIIQMISLPVSILSLCLTFAILDEMLHDDEIGVLDLKPDKLLLFVTHIFMVTSRVFAIAFFMVSYKWWIVCVIVFHSFTLLLIDTIVVFLIGKLTATAALVAACFSFLNWLRDDLSLGLYIDTAENDDVTRIHLIRMQYLCDILFAVESVVIISIFYFGQDVNTWYSLPVTVSVGLLSYLGTMIRIFHFKFLRRNCTEYSMNEEVPPDHDLPVSPTILYIAE